jgi:hypothetical protein
MDADMLLGRTEAGDQKKAESVHNPGLLHSFLIPVRILIKAFPETPLFGALDSHRRWHDTNDDVESLSGRG